MRIFWTLCAALLAAAITSCGGRSESTRAGGDTLTTHSQLLTLVDYGDHMIADITNPWDTTAKLQRLVLVHRDSTLPADLPEGIILRYPLRSSLVYSSVHAGAIKEIGAIDAVTGVAEAEYYKIPEIVQGLQSGRVTDVGNSQSPSLERVMMARPDAILASPFQNQNHGAVEQSGIPIIECADYMESTPLGRAEWIKLLGALYGRQASADSIFSAVAGEYATLSSQSFASHPKVISETVTDGVWYVPGGRSYMAHLFKDAGADYPWADDTSTGSLSLDFANVYDKAHDADVWLIKTFGTTQTLPDLKAKYPLNERFDAFKNGGIYSCDTKSTTLFEDFPFHPEKLLAEYIKIFHHTNLDQLRYYSNVK